MGKRFVLKNSHLTVAITIMLSLIKRPAEAKGKARLSYRLAEAICASAVKFAASNQIERPLQFPSVKDVPCKILTWNKCLTAGAACSKFSLKHCSSSSTQPKPKPRKLKILNNKNKRQKKPRIVNGTNAMPYEFPYQVQITDNGYHMCGGTILNEDYILTAAHCFFDDDGVRVNKTLEIIAGQHSIDEEGGVEQFRNVKTIIIHEDYDTDTKDNDISLILLNYALALTPRVQPVMMPPPNHDATGQIATVTGWGHNETDGFISNILQKVELPIISNEECNKAYSRPEDSPIPDTAFCTLYPGGGKDACQGDSGGPVSLKLKNGSYLLIGVVSNGDGCASAEFPGVYTKVSKYIDWIQLNAV